MSIEFRCDKCEKKLKVKEELAGKRIKCPLCKEPTQVPAGETPPKQELNPDLNSTESIMTLNLKKFKNKAIDPDDEDVNLDELEGAVVIRKKREMEIESGPPKEPLLPMDWVFGLLFQGFCLIYPIVLLIQGKRSRGLKVLMLSIGVSVFWGIVMTLFALAFSKLS